MDPEVSFSQFPRPYRAHYWWEKIQAWRASGLLQGEFCAREGLNAGTMSRWKGRLRSLLLNPPSCDPESPVEQSGEDVSFIPVKVLGQEIPATDLEVETAPWLEIVLPGDRKVRVPPGFDPQSLKHLLGTLEDL